MKNKHKTTHILITNDDGVHAPGILALQSALRRVPNTSVTIMAPAENQSAVGHRKTMHKPLRVNPVTLSDGNTAFACSGSPADAIALALMGFVNDPVDIIVSGINQGPNLGQDITYSGTVTAAMEAALFGIPAIAMSFDSFTEQTFEEAAAVAVKLVPVVLEKGLPDLTLLNVNVPCAGIKGIRLTRQGRRHYHDVLIERIDPFGRPYYWIGGEQPTGDIDEVGTDVWAIANDYVSITPIRLEMTARNFMPEIEEWHLENLEI
ncbi:MAG: 5'/3'-nucleotidase SurE [Anaerolineae bacterium]|nr:5'/3'-nucleotidase SurE [Anaerolineae bacterium]